MTNIEIFPSKLMYLYLSLVERKVADFYDNMDGRRYLVKLTSLHHLGKLLVSSSCMCEVITKLFCSLRILKSMEPCVNLPIFSDNQTQVGERMVSSCCFFLCLSQNSMFHANDFLNATTNIRKKKIIQFQTRSQNHSSSHLLYFFSFEFK